MISKHILSIGVDDNDLDLFEGQYLIPNGISYNSYLIMDEKVAIMDTVDKRKSMEFLDNLHKQLKGCTPDYLIISHAEPDHASSLRMLLEIYPEICVVGNEKTFRILSLYLDELPKNILFVKEGDLLSLGKHYLTFFMAPMVHWPEVMVSYEKTTHTLFSADAFGKFGALNTTRENSALPEALKDAWLCEARRYYFNIVGKYGSPVQALLKKISTLNIQTIAPLHGPVLQAPLDFYLNKYDLWSRYQPETDGVFIAYTSFHQNTASAALLLKNYLSEAGCSHTETSDLARDDMAKAIENAFRYSTLVLAAPSYDGGLMPFMEDFLHHLKAKNFQNRQVALIENGSWAPCAGKIMSDMLSGMKDIRFLAPLITLNGSLKPSETEKLKMLTHILVP